MSTGTIQINLRINFPVIFIAVLFLHLLGLIIQSPKHFTFFSPPAQEKDERRPLQIRNIRTVGSRESKIKNSTYLSKNETNDTKVSPNPYAPVKSNDRSNVQSSPSTPSQAHKKPLSLQDLSATKAPVMAKAQPKMQRPGTRPEMTAETKKAISAISLKGSQIQDFAQSSNVSRASSAASMSGDPRTRSLSNSDILVNLEVPEGVNPDELNKYELMFYGFQRRTAINYVNSFYKNLDKFQRENPHLNFPLTDTKQIMTGRLTYDEKGNIKQIKMIRWSNVDRLQDFFVDVVKDMDTLHNPPQALWEKTGEFSIFFSFVVNG